MRSEQPSPNFVFLGDLLHCAWFSALDRLAQVAFETNATTAPRLGRFMREREGCQ